MVRPNGHRGYSARKRESRRSNSRASNLQIQGPEETYLAYIYVLLERRHFHFFTLLLTRSLGFNSAQLRKWHPDLRHGQREF